MGSTASGCTLDAYYGNRGVFQRPGTSKAAPGTRYTSAYCCAPVEDCRAEPGVGGRRDLHPDGVRLPLSGERSLIRASRAVLAWRLSNINDASSARRRWRRRCCWFGKPRIFNTDQGSTFTAEAFTSKAS